MRLAGAPLAAALAALGPALAAAAPLDAARPALPPRAVAFLGLRPTETAAFGATALTRLSEAQRLRAVAENVVGLVAGVPVLRHEELRALAGTTYLAELFECEGDVACELGVAAPLRKAGVAVAFTGDVALEPEAILVRLRRLDLAAGRRADELTFAIARDDASRLAAWRGALEPFFQDTGSIRIASNLDDATCTLDGRPCEGGEGGEGGVLRGVPEGEHVLELTREGYRRAVRALTVRRGEEVRVALALEELPVQAQKPPDPNSRVPTFAAPGETTRVAPFGSLRLSMAWDDHNHGDREDPAAPPPGDGVAQGHLLVLPRPAIIGFTIQAPRRESGWQLRGAFSTAWVKDSGPEIDSAFAEVVKEDAGFRVLLGFGPGIVSGLTAGTLTLPEGFGDLSAGFIGVTVSRSFGDVVLEAFGGRHKSQLSAQPEPAAASPGPFGAARVALVHEEWEGRLYGEEFPFTVALSGLLGTERVGLPAEAAALGGVAPVREQSRVWLGSFEAFVPFGTRLSLAGEAWVGQNVHLLEGALWQLPRVDPATGRHTGIRSAGGWAQVCAGVGGDVELRLVGGADRAMSGLAAGIAPDGSPAVRQNRLVALNAVWYLLDHLSLGVQVHAIRTWYADPAQGRPTLLGTVFTSQLRF